MKAYKIKPSIKQKKAVDKIIENHGNISRAMIDAGYNLNTAKNPSNLTNSKGFKILCNEIGLTDDLIANSLKDDIQAKPGNRKPELELASKLKGLLNEKDQTAINKGLIINVINYNDKQQKPLKPQISTKTNVQN